MSISFKPPENFKPPEDIKDGMEFKQLVTLKLDGDKLVLCAVGDSPLEDDEDYGTAVAKRFKKMKGKTDDESTAS